MRNSYSIMPVLSKLYRCEDMHVIWIKSDYFYYFFCKLNLVILGVFTIKVNQLTVMCTTLGERRLIGFRCHKACMKSKLIISCRMMHNLIKRFKSYFTD